MHPAALEIVRAPIQDDVLPLTKPFVGTSGRVYTELPIPEATAIYISAIGYNSYVCPTWLPSLESAHRDQEPGFVGLRRL